MAVKLHNKGKRTIEYKGNNFDAGSTANFTEDAAKYLRKLYPNEVVDVNDVIKDFSGEESGGEETVSIKDMKVAELKEHLDAAGIEYPSDAVKADLIEIAEAAAEGNNE
ncbi:HeH/LEM domain-containing protein [uncultured Paraglaciecola sp.]|uniref:HeH/LEM domain-containing protein n=1 Tax=uncultured Paraglaciecola sp. TaxID=1765024 RepID=UPI0026057511|nr:HeH/LEM domain-containing protein [uncultured Paraglaciecola sp.]